MPLPVTPYKIKKGFSYWKHFGTKEFLTRVRDRLEPEDVPYGPWRTSHAASDEELKRQRQNPPADGPLISVVVPAWHTEERYLAQMIDSVRDQSYEKWELVIADAGAGGEIKEKRRTRRGHTVAEVVKKYEETDGRIRYLPLAENFGISGNTNRALEEARGDYVAFLDHDDLIEPDALYELARAAVTKKADMIYTDEDKVTSDRARYYQPHFKPEFNLDLLRSNNYITHLLCVKRTLIEKAGKFDGEMNGAQDYDFIFRCAEQASRIVRIPRILYHWRTHEKSTADNPMSKAYAYDAGKRAIERNLERSGIRASVEELRDFGFYRVHYAVTGHPRVSVIIPNRDEAGTLKECVDSILETKYPNLEIIIIENGSRRRETFEYYRELSERDEVHLLLWRKGFNYSAINNYGVEHASGEYLLFMNNDVRGTIRQDWLQEMLSVCARNDVGAVGAKLLYPDNRIQSAGIVIGMGGIAGSMFVDLPAERSGYLHKASLMQDVSAVTAACMMTKKNAFERVGGFTPDLGVAFNDVDFCLKLGRAGYRVVYDPFAVLYHDESRTRGPEDTEEKIRRFQGESEYFKKHWAAVLKHGDPNYNPNLSLKKWNYSLKV